MAELTKEQWTLVRGVVAKALDRPADEREGFVRSAIVLDPALTDYALDMLDSILTERDAPVLPVGKTAEQFVDEAFGHWLEMRPSEGERVGPYRLLHQIGEGGMGSVYLGERADGLFDRKVAIKFVREGARRPSVLRSFHTEQQILAGLNHPGIARMYGGGVSDSGVPYFVMEFIDGTPITEYCVVNDLDLDDRLLLFAHVCDAVAYAQRHLVVHRDLKPSNIMVTTEGRVKLLDFGIAKVIESDSDARQTMNKLLTPAYAAPEQLTNGMITTATDVYALGIVLFEIVTGRLPYDLKHDSQVELARAICEVEPVRASTAVTDIGSSRDEGASAARPHSRFQRALFGDLDAIIALALRKNPVDRYPSAGAMGDDIRRHFERKPVVARKGSRWYEVRRWAVRHRMGLAVALILSTVTIGVSILAGYHFSKLTQERESGRTISRVLTLLESSGIPADALPKVDSLMIDVLTVKQSLLDEHDPQIVATLRTLAEVRRRQGDRDASKAYLQQAIVLLEESNEVDLAQLNEITLELAIDEAHLGDRETALQLVDRVWKTTDNPRLEPWWHLAMYALNGALRDSPSDFAKYGGQEGTLTVRLDARQLLEDWNLSEPPRFGVIGYWPGLDRPTTLRQGDIKDLYTADLKVYAPLGVHLTYSFFYWNPETDSLTFDWSETRQSFRGTAVLPTHVWGESTHGVLSRVIRVSALIDGRSRLVFAHGNVLWHHIDGDAPGRFANVETSESDYSETPTIVGEMEWTPTWPDVPDRSNRDCNCMSSSAAIPLTLARAAERPVEVKTLKGRNGVRLVVWEPDSLVIEFDDPWAGWDYYETELVLAEY